MTHVSPETSIASSRNAASSTLPPNLTLALVVIAAAQLMVVLDATIVNIALPSIQRALQFSATGLEWVINAYALTFGGLLIIARAAQGIGAAIVAPTALSLIADTFREGPERNRALGVYGAVAGTGGALGLLLGGLLTSFATWRWVLFVNVPIGIVLAIVAPRVLAASPGRDGRLDLPGAFTATGGMVLLVYGLSHVAAYGWTDAMALTFFPSSSGWPFSASSSS